MKGGYYHFALLICRPEFFATCTHGGCGAGKSRFHFGFSVFVDTESVFPSAVFIPLNYIGGTMLAASLVVSLADTHGFPVLIVNKYFDVFDSDFVFQAVPPFYTK